jgi:hypothetical protein
LHPGTDPTIASYNASAVKIKNTARSRVTRLGEYFAHLFRPFGKWYVRLFFVNYRSSKTMQATFSAVNLLIYKKMGWATLWAIFSDSSDHPDKKPNMYVLLL